MTIALERLTFCLVIVLSAVAISAEEPADAVRTVASEADFAAAIDDAAVQVIVCRRPFVITKDHEFGKKDLIACPGAFDFSGGGTLHGDGSISRLGNRATYPVFVNAKVGFWHYYSGRVTYHGKTYAALPGQETPPSVTGSFNGAERDVTLWKQWHDGAINDAIEAAQNSLPRKGDRGADWHGTVVLPSGQYEITHPIYITVGGKIVGAGGRGTLGTGGCSETQIAPAEEFGPEKTYPTGHDSPIPGGGRLWDIPEDYMVVFIPQNRNNQSRVNVGGGGGDGKSVFYCGLEGIRLDCDDRTNGVLVHASSGSVIQNIAVRCAVQNAMTWHGSDAHVARNISVSRSPVGLNFTGSNIDVTIDNVIFTQLGVGFQYVELNNRSASIELRNINSEGTGLLFHVRNPDAVSLSQFTHTVVDPQHRVGIIDVGSEGQHWPPLGFRAFGSVLGAGYIKVICRGAVDQWRVSTAQVDNDWTPQDDWKAKGYGSKRGTLDFDLRREFGSGRQRRAMNYPGADAYRIAPLQP